MPRSCEAAHEDSKVEAQKGGEIHHIATGHGPMVQGRLLTAHPGDVHGRQGAGAASPGSPDLETAAAVVQRRDRGKEIDIRGFHPEG